jgi:serine protease inhibitor
MKQRNDGFLAGTALGTVLAAALVLAGCGGGGMGAGAGSNTGAGTGTGMQSPTSSAPNSAPTAVAQALKSDSPVDPAIVSADNAFGLSVLDALLPAGNGANVAISPLSVALALQILYNGAGGATQQALAQTLELGALSLGTLNSDNAALQAALISPDPAVQLVVANSLWLNQGSSTVSAAFTQTDQTYYGATVGDLAGAPADVNAWVDSETQGLITQLLPPGTYQDAIIANVLYFKGQWTTPFNPDSTAAAPFTLSGGSQTTAQLMQQTGSFPYGSGTLYGTNYQAIRLPYGQNRFSMLIILPDAGANVTSFVGNITVNDLNNVAAQLEPAMVALELPRFTASYGTSLVPALQSLGMGIAFTPAADFSALAPGFWVNTVEHKTVVEVDETGTVAAGATGVGTIAAVTQTYPMVVNRPFFYAIEDGETGALLFIGVLMNPS